MDITEGYCGNCNDWTGVPERPQYVAEKEKEWVVKWSSPKGGKGVVITTSWKLTMKVAAWMLQRQWGEVTVEEVDHEHSWRDWSHPDALDPTREIRHCGCGATESRHVR